MCGFSCAVSSQCGAAMSEGGGISWLRVTLLVVGVLAIVPMTLLFGLYGFIGALFFLLLAAIAK